MREPTVRDALIAEILGDIGKLHDAVTTLTTTLSNQVVQTQKETNQIVDFLRIAGDEFQKKIHLNTALTSEKNDQKPSHFELFKDVHEQWASDARAIGEAMNKAQEKIDASLAQLALQGGRSQPSQQHQPQARRIENPPRKSLVLSWVSAVLLTSACFVGGYYISGMDKTVRLGDALTRDWLKLDLATRTKITETIKNR